MDRSTDHKAACSGTCPPLQTDTSQGATFKFYGYNAGWTNTNFTRTVTAQFIPGTINEVKITVRIDWISGGFQARTFQISDNLYRWINDGSGSH